jgi:acyl-CoA synthetase (AMP-forming)/AMP-acid ligase II/acyl carrier protein
MNADPRQAFARTPPVAATPGLDLVDWTRDTLVDLMTRRAAETPTKILYTFLEDGEARERSMTAGELETSARRIGRALSKLAAPGDRVMLLFDDGVDYIAGLFACLSAGLVAVSGVHPGAPRGAERLLGIVRDCQATIMLGHARVLAEFQRALDAEPDALDLRWVTTDRARASSPADAMAALAWRGQPAANEGLALIQYTSGSSREPRGVMLTHRNILHNLRGQALAFGYRQGDTGVSWLPFSHDMGLIGCVLMALYGGGRCVLLSPAHFLEDPSRWLRAISRYRATLSGGPSFAYDLCVQRAEAIDLDALDLSSWSVAVNGAEPIRAEVLRRFARTFAPAGFDEHAIHPSYGLAEATLMVTGGARLEPYVARAFDKASLRRDIALPLPDDAPDGAELVGCGPAMPDQHLAIVDPKTMARLGPGRIGEIWIAGPSIAAGYFGRADENALYFGGDLGDGFGPYLKTGDLGFILDGNLYVTGRSRDLLIVRAKNYYPQDLEYSAEASHPAVRPTGTACFLAEENGDLVVVAELLRARNDEAAEAAAAIRAAILRDHGLNPRRVALVAWGAVLKTPSGKVQRAQTRAALAEGQIVVIHESVVAERSAEPRSVAPAGPVDFAHIVDWFIAKLPDTGVDVARLDPTTKLAELGFDSLRILELKVELERDLGIAIPVADLYAFTDIQSLADYLRAETAKKRGDPPTTTTSASAARPPRAQNRLAEQRQRRTASTGAPAL